MGWFDEQIKERKKLDDEIFSDSFVEMAGAIMGEKVLNALKDQRVRIKDSIDEILKYYHVKSRDIPDSITDVNDQLEYLLRPYGIMRRTVQLEKGWHKDAVGALLTTRVEDGSIVAMIPSGLSGYSYYDVSSGKHVKITGKNEAQFDNEAIAFYKPFPLRKIGIPDLFAYMAQAINVSDIVLLAVATLVITLVAKLLPRINSLLYGSIVDSGSVSLLVTAAVFLICVNISSQLFGAIKTLFETRINTKLDISVAAATMMRVLSLPAPFFKEHSAGELSSRVSSMSLLCEMLVSSLLTTGLTSVFSLIYISDIFNYAPALVVPSLLIILATTIFSVISTLVKMKLVRKQMATEATVSGISYSLISGVQKIKLSGSEKRAFAKWGEAYSKNAALAYNTKPFIAANSAFATLISLVGTIVLYYEAVQSNISVSDYIAFFSAYGLISGAFAGLVSIAQNIAQINPILEMVKPIMDTAPEVSEGKEVVTSLSGAIELNNVSFRYSESTPNIVDDMSLKIRPGQYVAIVGKTGCGKSTLMRLLLGFETPQKGAIYYDGKDMNSIDLKSLRRKIGVVMQEGKLFQGDIFSNITISAPWLTLDEAWEAAEMSGIADDIKRMPMGMHTIISEGSGGISGGQRQRLMISRAIAPKPKILMFDEATSALDNITQKTVSESLDSLKCTRIVIAHRLSTIRHCDRIICLDGGHIIEDGTYDELIAAGGFFAELVARQRVDTEA